MNRARGNAHCSDNISSSWISCRVQGDEGDGGDEGHEGEGAPRITLIDIPLSPHAWRVAREQPCEKSRLQKRASTKETMGKRANMRVSERASKGERKDEQACKCVNAKR